MVKRALAVSLVGAVAVAGVLLVPRVALSQQGSGMMGGSGGSGMGPGMMVDNGAASADAAATFKAKCAMCHGPEGAGGAVHKASIKGTREADVLKAINDGKGKMKPVKIDNDAAVAKWVSSLK